MRASMSVAKAMRCAALALIVGTALCAAAPKVEIRVIQRPQAEPLSSEESGPIPFRAPADPAGPFSSYVDTVGCLKNIEVDFGGQSGLLDICHLKNVTFVQQTLSTAETTEGSSSSSSSGDTASTPVVPPQPTRKILGIFRGWKIDPIYKQFKYAEFDDGDLCGNYGVERLSVSVELVRSLQHDATPRAFDIKQVTACKYSLRVELYFPEWELYAPSGIHTPGVVDISDANEMLPKICGEMKCQYSHIGGRVTAVEQEIQSMKDTLKELAAADSSSVAKLSLSTASSIIQSSTDVLEKALETLQAIEQLEKNLEETRKLALAAIASKQPVVSEQTEVVASS